MKYIAFILIVASTQSFALSLRVSVPPKNPIHPYKNIDALTYCSLASVKAKKTAVDPLPSRRWQITIKELIFADGSQITKDDLLTSIALSKPHIRAMLTKLRIKNHVVNLTTKIPLHDLTPFLDWPVFGTKPSRFCGDWKSVSGDLNHLQMDNGKHQLLINFTDQKNSLEDLSKGLIDVLIPETWTEIENYLRKNPHIKLLTTTQPTRFYFHLNPNKSMTRQTRIEILAKFKKADIAFPFTKKEENKNATISPVSSAVSEQNNVQNPKQITQETSAKTTKPTPLVTSTLTFPEPIRLLKSILISYKTAEENSSIRVSDESTLDYEIKTNQLDGWLLSQDMPWINYHSKIASELYGKAAWSSATLDKLIEDHLKDKEDISLQKVLTFLENEGLMKEIAEINLLALAGKSVNNLKLNSPGEGGRFLEKVFENENLPGK